MKVSRLSEDELDPPVVAALNSTGLFASIPFSKVWRAVGGSPVWWAAHEQEQIVGVLPGVEFGGKWFRRFQAMPDGCYAQLHLFQSDDENGMIAGAVVDAVCKFGYAKVSIYDFHGQFGGADAVDRIGCTTGIADIAPDWSPPDDKLRSEIRKAEKEGVVVEPFDKSYHLPGFLELVRLTTERHGSNRKYPDEFYSALAEVSRTDQRVRWYWVERDSRAVASHINFVLGNMLLNWQVVSDRGFSYLKANQLLLFQAVINAAREGVTRLNLGASPPEAESLIEYKEKWGGSEVSYDCLVSRNWLGRMLR